MSNIIPASQPPKWLEDYIRAEVARQVQDALNRAPYLVGERGPEILDPRMRR